MGKKGLGMNSQKKSCRKSRTGRRAMSRVAYKSLFRSSNSPAPHKTLLPARIRFTWTKIGPDTALPTSLHLSSIFQVLRGKHSHPWRLVCSRNGWYVLIRHQFVEKENLVLGIGGNSGDNYFEYPVNSIKMLIIPFATKKNRYWCWKDEFRELSFDETLETISIIRYPSPICACRALP